MGAFFTGFPSHSTTDFLQGRLSLLFRSSPRAGFPGSWSAQLITVVRLLVSRAMLSRYSHVRMEAKRRALDEIAARQGPTRSARAKPKGRSRLWWLLSHPWFSNRQRLTHLLHHVGGSCSFPAGCNFENGLVTRFLSA